MNQVFLLLLFFVSVSGVTKHCLLVAKPLLCERFRPGGTRSCMNDVFSAARYYEKDDCMTFFSDNYHASKYIFTFQHFVNKN